MGDYTKLKIADVQTILALYNDDKVESLRALSLGISNSNYASNEPFYGLFCRIYSVVVFAEVYSVIQLIVNSFISLQIRFFLSLYLLFQM